MIQQIYGYDRPLKLEEGPLADLPTVGKLTHYQFSVCLDETPHKGYQIC